MNLLNLEIMGQEGYQDINIRKAYIQSVRKSEQPDHKMDGKNSIIFHNAMAFPGMINSHDHLDFNLFPQLANRVYASYREWGRDIHHQNKKEIDAVLRIPKSLRIRWGIYKNLINGFTTVVNHGAILKIDQPLIHVYQKAYSLHSPAFERNWKWKINNPFLNRKEVCIHLGEGKDEESKKEIDQLIRYNFLKKKLVAVHAVAMIENQSSYFSALVWCPASNEFLLRAAAPMHQLKHSSRILFGSDSTLTSAWNIWEHIRLARKLGFLTDQELIEGMTVNAAHVWKLPDSGRIEEGGYADIVISKKKQNESQPESFFSLNPEDILLIIQKGEIRLYDQILEIQINEENKSGHAFSRVRINESTKYIQGDLRGLIKEIYQHCPGIKLPVSI